MSDAPSAQPDSQPISLGYDDLPPLFHHAVKRSVRAQRQFFSELAAELILLALGVLVGAFSGSLDSIGSFSLVAPPFTVIGIHVPELTAFQFAEAALIALALLMRLIRGFTRPERLWYEARAVAESVKSLAWRYAVGGEPFQESLSPEELDAVVADRFGGIRTDLSKYQAPEHVAGQGQITPGMRRMRALTLTQRKRAYRADRVDEQQVWYTKNSRFNRLRGGQAHLILVVVEAFGVCAALLPLALAAIHLFPLSLQSLATNVAGGGAAWIQAKRYEDLTASYKVTASELKQVSADIEKAQDEPAWARFVENAEGSMSREHQLWRATRVD